MNSDIGIWQFVIALGLPTTIFGGIMGIFFRRFEKHLAEKEKAREDHDFLILKSIHASIELGEATAECIQRLDTACNGSMKSALTYVREVKHEQKDFLNRQAVKAVV